MKISAIYKIESKIKPDRIYIGSSNNTNSRWKLHLRSLNRNIHHSLKLQRHFNKYGESDLQFSVIMNCGEDILFKEEQYFLDLYKPYFNNCLFANSLVGIKRSQETKDKISIYRTGKKQSDEAKKKIGDAKRGNNHYLYGKHMSNECKKKIGLANKNHDHGFKKGHKINIGRKPSNESLIKMSESQKKVDRSKTRGRKNSIETIKRMSQSKLGNKSCVGRILSEETKRKIIETRNKNKLLKDVA